MQVKNVILFSTDQFYLLKRVQNLNDVGTAHVRGNDFSRLRHLLSEPRVHPASRRMRIECSVHDRAAGASGCEELL